MGTEATALGWSITANIDGNRQIVLQSFFAADATPADANAMLDMANALVDRQRAKYEIPDLEKERAKYIDEIKQATLDLAESEQNFLKAQAELDVQASEFQASKDETLKAGYDAHVAGGRQGAYTPKGNTISTIARMDTALKQVAETKQKNENERAQAQQGMEIAIGRRNDRIAEIDRRLAELKAQIG